MTTLSKQQLRDFLDAYPHSDMADIGGAENPGIEADVFDLPFDICKEALPRKYGTIICMDTFEHIFDPVRAAENIVKSLDGYLFLTTVFSYPKHNHPIDTYRYTDTALEMLFADLKIIKCWFSDEEKEEWGNRIRVSLIASS